MPEFNVKMIVATGSTEARPVWLRAEETIVGRKLGCGIRIPATEVSRQHCLLRIQNGVLMVEDLDSVNGTFVNGRRITKKQMVRPGDKVQVGPVTFKADYQLAPGSDTSEEQVVEVVAEEEDAAAAEEVVEVMAEEEVAVAAKRDTEKETFTLQLEPNAMGAAGDDEEIIVELDDNVTSSLPEGQELRDILSHMDDKN